MRRCTICRYETELDDVAVSHITGMCICLRCYARETDSQRPMPKPLRRQIMAALAAVEPSF